VTIERALIAQSRSHIIASKAQAMIGEEVGKGCRPEISQYPVSLEPPFQPVWSLKENPEYPEHRIEKNPLSEKEIIRLRIWLSPEQDFDWNQSELFVKQLQPASFRIGFEVAGNNQAIVAAFFCHPHDLPIITSAFQGEFTSCELTPMKKAILSSLPRERLEDILFRDYFPPPPYSHLLTRPPELHASPLIPLITAMSNIKAPALGVYQALLQPVLPEHNWHKKTQILLDLEFAIKLIDGFHSPQRYAQQSPSGDLRQMAWGVENKAHNDKPFYAMALRVAIIGAGEEGDNTLAALSTFTSLFQHGGRPLSYLTEKDYQGILSPKEIRDMFTLGLTYRPGFLVNSWELTGPVHIPPIGVFEERAIPLEGLETLPVRNAELLTGTWIGTCNYAGESQCVCIPAGIRKRHTHLLGKTGVGKSTTQEHMILGDIEQGNGVAVLDPHGDLIERLLFLIPEKQVEKTIYLNPGDPDYVPLYNPLKPITGQDIGRTADDIVQAIKSFVSSGGWGDRLEHLLRNIIFSLFHMQNSTFLDISNLLRNKSEESKIMRREILKVVENENVRQFWLHDYEKYGKDDLGPPKNKLSKLLVSGTVSLMLSQPECRFNFQEIMDQGMILLINLSNMGSKVREVLGCFPSLHAPPHRPG